jgi:hypothetical protein
MLRFDGAAIRRYPTPFWLPSRKSASGNGCCPNKALRDIISAAMEGHLFLAVTCRTPGCTTGRLVKYIGPYSGEYKFQHLAPESFAYRCGKCKRTHHYLRDEVYPVKLAEGPQPGFKSAF